MARKHKAIKWTVENAASEFGINPRTLSGRLRQNGIAPDGDGAFTTKQICAAVFGDLDGVKLQKLKAEAELAELDLQRERGEVVEVRVLAEALNRFISAARAHILSLQSLDEDERDELLLKIKAIYAGAFADKAPKENTTDEN